MTTTAHPRRRTRLLAGLAAALGALLLAACAPGADADTAGLEPADRYVHVQATELDARRGLDQDPFPQATLDGWPQYFGEDGRGGDGGYYLFMSDEDEWRIGSYLFLPQEITFVQGDRVTLEIFGIRGSEHETVLESPSGEALEHFTVKRGELHEIEFTADEAGVYELICVTHPPTMTTRITVLPAGS